MIRFIAAIDEKQGLANDHGIPWQGKLPTDVAFFREKTLDSVVMMGYGTYVEFEKPLSRRRNLVATRSNEGLREGFEPVHDAVEYLSKTDEDIWVIGGAGLFAQTIELADELYITKVGGDWNCTKFFPEYKDKFELSSESEKKEENGITFQFEIWKRKA